MNRAVARRIVQVLASMFVFGAVLFCAAGTIRWTGAWALMGVNLVLLVINLVVLPMEVIEERGRKKENVKRWDRVLSSLAAVPILGVYLLAGLGHRFAWSDPLPTAVTAAALAAYLLSSLLFTWAMVSNRFFSTLVRIQHDRGHVVAEGGPYRFVRHPGYAGFIIQQLAVPMALDQPWALAAGGLAALMFVVRTVLEDRTLAAELPGYAEYTRRVPYRLVPRLW